MQRFAQFTLRRAKATRPTFAQFSTFRSKQQYSNPQFDTNRQEQDEAQQHEAQIAKKSPFYWVAFDAKYTLIAALAVAGYWLGSDLMQRDEAKQKEAEIHQRELQAKHVDPETLPITNVVYFEIEIGGKPAGTIYMGMFGTQVPKTVQNFVQLSQRTGDASKSKQAKSIDELQDIGYKGSIFHRVISKFMIQAGDILNHNGTGSYSIYGPNFDDENFDIPHFIGCLSCANRGANTNGSQFFITTARTPWLNYKHVVFGRVLDGWDTVKRIEAVQVDKASRPIHAVKIVKCGVVENVQQYLNAAKKE